MRLGAKTIEFLCEIHEWLYCAKNEKIAKKYSINCNKHFLPTLTIMTCLQIIKIFQVWHKVSKYYELIFFLKAEKLNNYAMHFIAFVFFPPKISLLLFFHIFYYFNFIYPLSPFITLATAPLASWSSQRGEEWTVIS